MSVEKDFHMPYGFVFEIGGVTLIHFTIYLSIDSPRDLEHQILSILDGHARNWIETEFSGTVVLNCWNDTLEDEQLVSIRKVLDIVVANAQDIVTSNELKSAEGNPIVFKTLLSKAPNSDFL